MRHRRLRAAIVTVLVAATAGTGYLAIRGQGRSGGDDELGMGHVHGLGLNPADDRLYAATHTGLFRLDGDGATRVADRYQDTMGFVVTGPDQFLASGHPDLREASRLGTPSLLGLVESDDGGQTWRPRSLSGAADLHTIRVAEDNLVAYDSTGGRLMVSDDGGATWETRSTVALLDVVVDPTDVAHLVATTAGGGLLSSGDGGRTWSLLATSPSIIEVLQWGPAGLWGAGADGSVYEFDPGARLWSVRHRFDAAVEALLTAGPETIYAAVTDSGIYRSDDSGGSWAELLEI